MRKEPGHSNDSLEEGGGGGWQSGEGKGRKKREEGMGSRIQPAQDWAQNSSLDQEALVSLLPVPLCALPLLPLPGLLHLGTPPYLLLNWDPCCFSKATPANRLT